MLINKKAGAVIKRTISILIICIIPIFIFSKSKNNSYQKIKWGMTKAQVKKIEKRKLIADKIKNLLCYDGEIAGLECDIVYVFNKHGLYQKEFVLQQWSTDSNDYIDHYNKLYKLLKKKYGKKISNEIIWTNDLYKNNRKSWGTAAILGHLQMHANCELIDKDTRITLHLVNHKLKVLIFLNYNSIKLSKFPFEDDKEKILKDKQPNQNEKTVSQ